MTTSVARAWTPSTVFGSCDAPADRARRVCDLLCLVDLRPADRLRARSPRASRVRSTCCRACGRPISGGGSSCSTACWKAFRWRSRRAFCGAILCVPLALCAARNLAPALVYAIARGLIVVGRTFHEVIVAILFVKLFGFGAVAGLLTLAFSSAVFLAKMIAEDIENIRPGPVEAVRATGARFGQVVTFAVLPQVMVRTLGVFIYRVDANLRHSTVIGIVGAGGIGQTLSASFSRYDYDFSAAILISIAVLVAFGEWFSDWVRRKLR